MNVLGVTDYPGSHDTSAAIVRNGRLVAAAEEERFTRRKHQGGIALRSIDYCLASAGLSMADIDVIALTEPPYRTGPASQLADTDIETLRRLRATGEVRFRSLVHKHWLDLAMALKLPTGRGPISKTGHAAVTTLTDRFGALPPLQFYDHHRCHAAAAYLTSPFEESAVLTIDGRGGNHATVLWSGRGNALRRLASEPYDNSLGHFYRDCTRYAGLGEFGEGKFMGLAAYGEPARYRDAVGRLLEPDIGAAYRYRRAPDGPALGFDAAGEHANVIEAPFPDFAASVQQALETAVIGLARSATREADSRNLALGGGVTLNCSANGALLEAAVADRYWLFPAAGDAGLSVGACLLSAAAAGRLDRSCAVDAYWGPGFDDAQCERALQESEGVAWEVVPDPAGRAAAQLAEGQVVGWFQGRMEIGPRALGNRSILADPRTVAMRDRVNRIKQREQWRPLAPAVLAERAAEYFITLPPSPFMLFAVQVRQSKRNEIAGVVHVDGSARPQCVSKEGNERFHDLIHAFGARTGVPVVMNTSFNLAGEPIVCTPKDAIRTFARSELDALVLGNCIVRHAR